MKDSGITLFTWDHKETKEEADQTALISGFLSALNMFAKHEKGEEIKKIRLDPTTFIFDKYEDVLIIILTKDIEYEKILFKILESITSSFVEHYKEVLTDFNGSVDVFEQFNNVIAFILEKYLYFDYIRTRDTFENNPRAKCYIIMDSSRGDFLYIKSKEYIDRGILSFQSTILWKTAERLINDILQAKLKKILILTEKNRCIYLKSSKDVLIFNEFNNPMEISELNIEIKEKKVKKMIRNPGKILFELKQKVAICDSNGKGHVSNDQNGFLDKNEIASDLLTLYNSSNNIVSNVYKDQISTVLLITKDSVFAAQNLGTYLSLLKISESSPNHVEFLNIVENIRFDPKIDNKHPDLEILKNHIEKIANFKKYFT